MKIVIPGRIKEIIIADIGAAMLTAGKQYAFFETDRIENPLDEIGAFDKGSKSLLTEIIDLLNSEQQINENIIKV